MEVMYSKIWHKILEKSIDRKKERCIKMLDKFNSFT